MDSVFRELRNAWGRLRETLQHVSDAAERRESVLAYFIAAIFTFALILSQGRMGAPFIFHDEFGFLANAAQLAGLDWRNVMEGTPYYGFGVSLLYVPLYWFFSDPYWIYHGALAINAVLIAAFYVAAWRILRFTFPANPPIVRLGAAALVVLYPSVYVYAHLVWSETALAFAAMAVVCLLFSISQRGESNWKIFWLTVLLAWIFAIHLRALALVLAVLFSMSFLFIACREARKPLARGFVIFVALMILAWFGKHYIVAEFLGPTTRGVQHSVTEFASSRLAGIASWSGIQAVFYSAVHQLFYIVTATYGLVVFGYFFCLSRALDHWKKREVKALMPWLTLILLPAMIFAVTSLSLIHGKRLDHLFYGRYIEAFLLPYLLFGAVWVMAFARRLSVPRFFVIVGVTGSTGVLIWLAMRGFDASGYSGINWINLTGWFPQRSGNWLFRPSEIAVSSTIGAVFLLMLARARHVLFILVCAILFYGAASETLDRFVVPASVGWSSIGKHLAPIRESDDLLHVGVAKEDTGDWKERHLVPLQAQIQLPEAPLEIVYDCSSVPGKLDVMLVPHGVPCELPDIYQAVVSGSRLSVFVNNDSDSSRNLYPAVPVSKDVARPSAKITIENGPGEVGGFMHHTLERLSRFYSLRFLRMAMPTVDVEVTNTGDGVYGSKEMLGVFFTQEGSESWVTEYRVELPSEMKPGESVELSVPVRINGRGQTSAQYVMHVALFDREGWNWPTSRSVQIQVSGDD
ncbi:MAG TPA: hypothetical protein VF275_02440 [Gammaproteobacteria bacterium]